MNPGNRSFGVLGVGAAACVACCAAPILGLLAATAGVITFGAVGLLAVVPALLLILRRGARRRAQTAPTSPVAVAPPVRIAR